MSKTSPSVGWVSALDRDDYCRTEGSDTSRQLCAQLSNPRVGDVPGGRRKYANACL